MTAADRAEFDEFMVSRWPLLVRLAFGLTGDRWLAEDLAQTALANAYMRRGGGCGAAAACGQLPFDVTVTFSSAPSW